MSRIKKAVVTGGAGFIGSHLVEELARRGYHVFILDDLSTGKIENIRTLISSTPHSSYLCHPAPSTVCRDEPSASCHSDPFTSCHSERSEESPGNIEFVQGSITDLPLLQRLFKGVDYVFHQAAIASVPRSIDDPLACHEVNVTGTLNVLLAARDNRVKKVVCASSSAVYGNTPFLPQREDMLPNPLSPYAVSKLAVEYYCKVFLTVYGLNTVSLRYFNVYGPRQSPDSQYAAVIPKFIKSILEGKIPVIFGDGEQSRDFTFVHDVVIANIIAAESSATGILNIGSGESISLNQLTRIMLQILNRTDIELVYHKERAGDIKHSLADIARARSFDYNPRYSVDAGILEIIKSDWNISRFNKRNM